jgi:hypothetical protein
VSNAPQQSTPQAPQVLEREVAPVMALGGEVDVQISTARRYPRSIKTFRDTALSMATLDEQTAASCIYAVPRDGKTIEGPSARLAEICASAWGHMRIEAKTVDEDDRFVTSRGTAWDLQANVAIAFEVRRRITGRQNKKYSDDMITTTANAASSIALRNAVFKVIPAAFWRQVYDAARKAAIGDVKTLATKRAEMAEYFGKMGVRPEQLIAAVGAASLEDITGDQLVTLRGIANSLKEGETTVEEAFPASTAPVTQPRAVTTPQATGQGTAPATSAPAATAPASTARTPHPSWPTTPVTEFRRDAVTITACEPETSPAGTPYHKVTLDTGEVFVVTDAAAGQATVALVGKRVDLDVRTARNLANAPILLKVAPVEG